MRVIELIGNVLFRKRLHIPAHGLKVRAIAG
jgi:hypothetical protein